MANQHQLSLKVQGENEGWHQPSPDREVRGLYLMDTAHEIGHGIQPGAQQLLNTLSLALPAVIKQQTEKGGSMVGARLLGMCSNCRSCHSE